MFSGVKTLTEIIFGCLACLWISLADNVLNRRISGRINANVASSKGVRAVLDAVMMIEVQFLNKVCALHNFPDRAGRPTVKSQANAERLRSARRKAREETDANESGACAERAGLPYPTIPYLTKPGKEGIINNDCIARARERLIIICCLSAFMWEKRVSPIYDHGIYR